MKNYKATSLYYGNFFLIKIDHRVSKGINISIRRFGETSLMGWTPQRLSNHPAVKFWPQFPHLSNESHENLSSPRRQVNPVLAVFLSLSGTRKTVRFSSVV